MEMTNEKLNGLAERYLQYVGSNFSKSTLRAYKSGIDTFVLWCKDNALDGKITPKEAKDFILWLKEVKGNNGKTQKTRLGCLSSFQSWLLENEFIGEDDTFINSRVSDAIKVKKTLPLYLEIEDVNKLLDQFDLESVDASGSKHIEVVSRNKAIMAVLITAGLRRQELCDLKIKDFDPSKNIIKVFDGKGNKDRVVDIPCQTTATINNYLFAHRGNALPNDFLFTASEHKGISTDLVYLIVTEATEKIGHKMSPHKMRVTFASIHASKGTDLFYLQQMMGHESISTTQIYTNQLHCGRGKEMTEKAFAGI